MECLSIVGMMAWSRAGFLHLANSNQMECLKLWIFWRSSRFLNHPWIVDAFKSSLRRCSQLTRGLLQENIAFDQVEFQGICTKEWLPHEYRSSLAVQMLWLSRSLRAWLLCQLNQLTNSEASSLCGKFFLNGGIPGLRGSGTRDFRLVQVAKCFALLLGISWDRILGIRILGKAVFHCRWLLLIYIEDLKFTKYNINLLNNIRMFKTLK